MKNEPENPVVYLSKLIKKLDVKKRNGMIALFIVNILIILLLKSYLISAGLLSWILKKCSKHFQIASPI